MKVLALPETSALVLLRSSKHTDRPELWSSSAAHCNGTNWVGAYKDGRLRFQTRTSGSDSSPRGCALVRYSYVRCNVCGKTQIFPPIFQGFSTNVSKSQPHGHRLMTTSVSPVSWSVRFVLKAANRRGPEESQGVG